MTDMYITAQKAYRNLRMKGKPPAKKEQHTQRLNEMHHIMTTYCMKIDEAVFYPFNYLPFYFYQSAVNRNEPLETLNRLYLDLLHSLREDMTNYVETHDNAA